MVSVMQRKIDVEVSQTVTVILLKAAFSETFMAEFRDGFYPFFELRDHAKHIGQLIARGGWTKSPPIPGAISLSKVTAPSENLLP